MGVEKKEAPGSGSLWMLTGITTAMGEVVGPLSLEQEAKGEKN